MFIFHAETWTGIPVTSVLSISAESDIRQSWGDVDTLLSYYRICIITSVKQKLWSGCEWVLPWLGPRICQFLHVHKLCVIMQFPGKGLFLQACVHSFKKRDRSNSYSREMSLILYPVNSSLLPSPNANSIFLWQVICWVPSQVSTSELQPANFLSHESDSTADFICFLGLTEFSPDIQTSYFFSFGAPNFINQSP